jgi:hypothetical protein
VGCLLQKTVGFHCPVESVTHKGRECHVMLRDSIAVDTDTSTAARDPVAETTDRDSQEHSSRMAMAVCPPDGAVANPHGDCQDDHPPPTGD